MELISESKVWDFFVSSFFVRVNVILIKCNRAHFYPL